MPETEGGKIMTNVKTENAMDRFVRSTRAIFASESNPEKRWQALGPVLQEMLADHDLRSASQGWPACNFKERVENLLFYEAPDYGFVINALKRNPDQPPAKHPTRPNWRGIHDHAHIYTLYGVLAGNEMIERYERMDDGTREGYCELTKTGDFQVAPGHVDLVKPYEIHAERSLGEATVAVIIRSEKSGEFLQGRYDPDNNEYWESLGPIQVPVEMIPESI